MTIEYQEVPSCEVLCEKFEDYEVVKGAQAKIARKFSEHLAKIN